MSRSLGGPTGFLKHRQSHRSLSTVVEKKLPVFHQESGGALNAKWGRRSVRANAQSANQARFSLAPLSLNRPNPPRSRIYAATNQPRINCFAEKIGVVRLVWVWPMWFFFARVALSHSLVEPVTTVECTEWMAAESLLHYRPLAD